MIAHDCSDEDLLEAASRNIENLGKEYVELDESKSAKLKCLALDSGQDVETYIKSKKGGYQLSEGLNSITVNSKILSPKRAHFSTKKIQTMGPGWFNVPAASLSPQVKYDLQIIRNRAGLDPKRHYRKGIMKELPKLFQVGTLIDDHLKPKHATIAQEVIKDDNLRLSVRRRFMKIQEKKSDFTLEGHRGYKPKKRKR